MSRVTRGATIISGDFNARYQAWDKTHNAAGRQLAWWAALHRITVAAPSTPSYQHNTRESTVDLTLVRGYKAQAPKARFGWWWRESHHHPVVTRLSLDKSTELEQTPLRAILDPKLQKEAETLYRLTIPPITAKLAWATQPAEINKDLHEFTVALHQPFCHVLRPKLQRARVRWNRHLDQMAKKRTRLYEQWKRSGDQGTKRTHDEIYLATGKQYRSNLRRLAQTTFQDPVSPKPVEAAAALARTLRVFKRSKTETAPPFPPSTYTNHYAANQPSEPVPCERFALPANFDKRVHTAIVQAPNKKAPGPDGLRVELFRLELKCCCHFLTQLWASVGKLGHMPEQLRLQTLVPLYKKGDQADPANYRPISLLSHARKVLSSAINRTVINSYSFHARQWGFSQNIGVEQALLAAKEAISEGHTYMAVFDLLKAYDKVCRHRLLQLCFQRLPQPIAAMISAMLQPTLARTKGQDPLETAI